MKYKLGNTLFSYSVKTSEGLLIPTNYIQRFLDDVAIQETKSVYKRNNHQLDKILESINDRISLVKRFPISKQGDFSELVTLETIAKKVKSMIVTEKMMSKWEKPLSVKSVITNSSKL